MLNFDFYSPTKIFFGRERENEIGPIIKQYGFKKILLHYGQTSIKKTGLYDRIVASLKEQEISFVELGGVEPNPKVDLVRKAIQLAKAEQVDLILAVGGGSVIDSGKATAVGACTEEDIWRFSMHELSPQKALPVGVILTISAAGSELSNSCVLTNSENWLKRGFNSDLIRPLFAIMNPELTFTVSKYQTGCGIVDIMMHTLERYFTDSKDVELSSYLAEGLLKAVIEAGKKTIENPHDYEARATLMLASSFSHNGLTGLGGKLYFTVHRLEHEVSGMFDRVAHGAGLAVLFPAWAKYVYKQFIGRFARFAYQVMDVSKDIKAEDAALEGIIRLEKYFQSLGMPVRLKELDIDETSFEQMAEKALGKNETLNGIIPLNKKQIIEIFEIAK
ncbi:MAG: iron-containing alcohol dehydrogenase [Bacilli bacterium]|jgi:alcohol dehydrogenase YqhD (iron-dependent ADH family)|nr:iron-containing alcohol dehydrogenase [Acholeplasmataceae bacterium]